jgi:hypothetical protein
MVLQDQYLLCHEKMALARCKEILEEVLKSFGQRPEEWQIEEHGSTPSRWQPEAGLSVRKGEIMEGGMRLACSRLKIPYKREP